jgi:hypothetical protein
MLKNLFKNLQKQMPCFTFLTEIKHMLTESADFKKK